MRFNNGSSRKWMPFVYFFLGIGSIVLLLFPSIFWEKNHLSQLWFLIPACILAFFGWVYSCAQYFEFDSDGNLLTFINKGLIISNYVNYRERKAEFPKEKLMHFRMQNYIICSFLTVSVRSKQQQIKRLQFNITLVSNQKKKLLKQSLTKVLMHNKEHS